MSDLILSKAAKSKINLFLHVTNKREDGYHDLQSLVVFTDFAKDHITIQKSDNFKLNITGRFAPLLLDQDNLVTRAHKAIENYTGRPLPCHIGLEKNIPLGAGLGGGSSDAAMAVKLMEEFFGIDIPMGDKSKILLGLGADVPVCYEQETLCFSGIGDVISDAPTLPKLNILILWPNIHSNTKDVFHAHRPEFSAHKRMPEHFQSLNDFVDFLKTTKNDLSDAAQELYPDIKSAYEWMAQQKGCLLARMTGSGSTIFGIFEDEDSCEKAHKNAHNHKDWWASFGVVRS